MGNDEKEYVSIGNSSRDWKSEIVEIEVDPSYRDIAIAAFIRRVLITAHTHRIVTSEMFTAGEPEMRLLAVCLMVVLTGCATQKGNDRHAQHAADQIRMVAVQREAMVQEAQADAQNRTPHLVEALAEVARANSPESC